MGSPSGGRDSWVLFHGNGKLLLYLMESISLCNRTISHSTFMFDFHANVTSKRLTVTYSGGQTKTRCPCSYKHCQKETNISRNPVTFIPEKQKRQTLQVCASDRVGWSFGAERKTRCGGRKKKKKGKPGGGDTAIATGTKQLALRAGHRRLLKN